MIVAVIVAVDLIAPVAVAALVNGNAHVNVNASAEPAQSDACDHVLCNQEHG